MLKLLLAVLQSETELTIAYKAKGHKVVKPSVVLVGLFTLFYLIAGVDLIPERFVKPFVFGLVDDLILLTACTIYIVSNINIEGGLENVRAIKIPDLSQIKRKSEVPLEDKRNNDVPSIVHPADSSSGNPSTVQAVSGDNPKPDINPGTNDNISFEDAVDGDQTSEQFTADDEDFFSGVFSSLEDK